MADLATLADVIARLGRDLTDDDEVNRVASLLADASAMVRAYTGQYIEEVEDDVQTFKVRCGRLLLPQRPVTAVTTITWAGTDIGFTWEGGDRVDWLTTGSIYRFDLDAPLDGSQWVTVTYTHGYDVIPADIVAVVCSVVLRASGRPADQTGLTQETLGSYSYSIGAVAGAGPLGLMQDERRILDLYRRPVGVAWTA